MIPGLYIEKADNDAGRNSGLMQEPGKAANKGGMRQGIGITLTGWILYYGK